MAIESTTQTSLPVSPLAGIHVAQFQSPLSPYLHSFTQMQVLQIVFALVFIVWLLYTLVALYHWVRYGHNSWLAVPALASHLAVSAFLFILAASGFHYGM